MTARPAPSRTSLLIALWTCSLAWGAVVALLVVAWRGGA